MAACSVAVRDVDGWPAAAGLMFALDLLHPPQALGKGGGCGHVGRRPIQGRHTLGQAVRVNGVGKFLQGISRV